MVRTYIDAAPAMAGGGPPKNALCRPQRLRQASGPASAPIHGRPRHHFTQTGSPL